MAQIQIQIIFEGHFIQIFEYLCSSLKSDALVYVSNTSMDPDVLVTMETGLLPQQNKPYKTCSAIY